MVVQYLVLIYAYIKDKINGINFSHKGLTIELVRGGIVTQVARTLKDTIRLGKFILSPKGVLSVKTSGIKFTKCKTETRTYNPLSLGSSVPFLHIDRHLELPQNPLSKQIGGVNVLKTTGIKYTDAKDYLDDESISSLH